MELFRLENATIMLLTDKTKYENTLHSVHNMLETYVQSIKMRITHINAHTLSYIPYTGAY